MLEQKGLLDFLIIPALGELSEMITKFIIC